eukprot:CAMPEP_0175370538 /NCGR_PEP_ID=MMETSP0095-20121207/21259_1 /TAXON_ID=311494 /ORGANISM="Alexandrium monilatum, Strain CCMP3105" /LENGTH=50 /DNA_ID=CAMNT_0016668689 /DNA_START=133 /DNA_END=285 /DNA_ORIENTATION=-
MGMCFMAFTLDWNCCAQKSLAPGWALKETCAVDVTDTSVELTGILQVREE